MPPEPDDIFEWLDEVRMRRGMYFTDLRDLESLIHGYLTALDVHGIRESGPTMFHFGEWLYYRTGWSTSCGWARAIKDHSSRRRDPGDIFFELLDEFRRLRPAQLAWVRLRSHHQPTGKRVVIGHAGRMERPNRVDIFRYQPAPLHFLRFHCGKRIVDDHLLYRSNGTFRTTIRDAKRWVADELGIDSDEWRLTR